MAVVNVSQMWSRDGGSVTAMQDDNQFREYMRTTAYQVLSDDPEENLNAIENAAGVPEIGDAYPTSNIAFCVSKTTSKIGPVFWQVQVEYKGDDSFLRNRPIIKRRGIITSEPIDVDFDGRAIVNVNNEPVEGLSRDIADLQVTVTRNFASIDDEIATNYLMASNSDTWYGKAPGRVRMVDYTVDEVFRNSTSTVPDYYVVTATMMVRRPYLTTSAQAWYIRYRNEGMLEKPDTGIFAGKIVPAVAESGEYATRPILLKENGAREDNPANAHFIYAKVYDSLPYNALGLL